MVLKIGQIWGFKKDIGDPWATEDSNTRAVIVDMQNGWVRYKFATGTKLMSIKQSAFSGIYDNLISEAPDGS